MLGNRYRSRGGAGPGGAARELRVARPRVTGPWPVAGVAPGGGPARGGERAGCAGRGGAARDPALGRAPPAGQRTARRPVSPPPSVASWARGLASQPMGGRAGDFLPHLFKKTAKAATKALKSYLVLVLKSGVKAKCPFIAFLPF